MDLRRIPSLIHNYNYFNERGNITVREKKLIGIVDVIFFVFIFILLCNTNSNKNNPAGINDTTKSVDTVGLVSYGTFLISLREDSVTAFLGRIYDGPQPVKTIWELVDSSGPCKLLKPRTPLCVEPCGSNAACVEDDSCQPYPTAISVGTVTISGIQTVNGTNTFTIDPINAYYQPAVSLKFPPFNEGDIVTLSAAGSDKISQFTLKAIGFKPIVVINDSFPCADGESMEVRWIPPAKDLKTVIYIMVDVSYHGGSKGKIECECADNGSVVIPASLLDKLKSFGISGHPKIEITRRYATIDPVSKVKLLIESKVTRFLSIPGIISCSEDSECPEGQSCGWDLRCREIEE
jgi:hypothetical protein